MIMSREISVRLNDRSIVVGVIFNGGVDRGMGIQYTVPVHELLQYSHMYCFEEGGHNTKKTLADYISDFIASKDKNGLNSFEEVSYILSDKSFIKSRLMPDMKGLVDRFSRAI